MPSQSGSNLRGDHGGKAFAKSEWATKINERSVAKQMPLMGEFSSYSEWETEAQRWTRMLYNRPISLVIDYFIINLKDTEVRRDFEASGFLKRKSKSRKMMRMKKLLRRGMFMNL